ncbi:PAS domain S-box protein [Bowmanella pacifica]|nr:PAS domain S-box protein [Bowmanella pacifica]
MHLKSVRNMLWLALFSPFTYATSESATMLDPQITQILLIVVLVVALLLAGAWLLARRRVGQQQTEMAEQKAQLHNKQSLLDGFNLGMLHLDSQGNVLYVNRIAAYWLGGKAESLLGTELSRWVQEEAASPLLGALSSLVDCKVQWFSPKAERHILLSAYPLSKPKDELAMILTLQDVSSYQQQITELQDDVACLDGLRGQAGLAQLSLNLKDKQASADPLLQSWLGLAQAECSLDALKAKVLSSDWANWILAIEHSIDDNELDLAGSLETPHGQKPVRLLGRIVQRDDGNRPQLLQCQLQDLTEINQAKRNLDASRSQFKSLLTASSQPLYLLNAQGEFVDCNLAFQRLFGVSMMQLQGKTVELVGLFDDAVCQLHQSGDLAMSSMAGQGREFNVPFKDGSLRPLRFRLQPLKDGEGNRHGTLGQIEDLSELRGIQANLREIQQQFDQFMNASPLGIVLMDAEEHLRQANQPMLERFGYSELELNKMSLYQLFAEPGQAARAAKQLQQDKLSALHVSLKDKHGKIHPSELHVHAIGEGQYLCWIADMSEKAFQQDKFESLLAHSSLAMAVLSDSGFTRLNPAACEFFAIEDEQQLFGFFPYSEGLNPDAESADKLKQKFQQLRSDGKALSLVWQHQHGNEALPCQATYVPMFKGGVLESVLCIWMDMRAINQAAAERLEAINLRQAAERQMAEQQQLLQNSQDQLASKAKSLVDTQSKLQRAQESLSEQQNKIDDLKQAHQDVTAHLQELQQEYSESCKQLADSQQNNAELETQLEQFSSKVGALEKQRNQIADALQHSERQYRRTQQQLQESEEAGQKLREEQDAQAQKMQQLVEQNSSLKDSIQSKDKQIEDVSGQINTLQSQLLSSAEASESLRTQLANQRKASEQAQQLHREVEQRCRLAQSELSNKARQIEHLQYEMQKVEEMSSQQRDDLEEQHKLLQQELQAKHQQLQETQQTLDETRRQSEQEKAEKQQQQAHLTKLQQELSEMEQRAAEQQQQVESVEQEWLNKQAALQQELADKQQKLQQTEQILQDAKQQTEAEKAEKARQQEIYDKLKAELADVEQRAVEQQSQMSQSDEQWQTKQQAMQDELVAKQQQLQQTQARLNEYQRQADDEKQQRQEQQMKLDQLKVELQDVESRASRQKELMAGSDEQWRQHQADMDEQKLQLQQALEQARKQNQEMESQLKAKLSELQQAESQVQKTQSGEQKLLDELNQSRRDAEALKKKLQQQEAQEASLQQQLQAQQQVLKDSESNIQKLEDAQSALTSQLQSVQKEYEQSRRQLNDQSSSQSDLSSRMQALEQELQQSRAQLDDRESALQDAQKALHSSQQKLAEQEQALVQAHQQELQQARAEQAEQPQKAKPAFAEQPMPDTPKVWFDLLPYLQKNPHTGSLAGALNQLMQALEQATSQADTAINEEDTRQMLQATRQLVKLAEQINSEPLMDLTSRLEAAAKLGHLDSISIFWPNVKRSLMMTLRVIYSHLDG